MKSSKFSGVGVALVTPFNEDLSVDYPSLETVINNCIEGGVDYLVSNGTTAEASTLTPQEKKDILAFVKKVNKGRLPILYGIGSNNTKHALELIHETDFNGVDGILTISPYYNKPSQQGIIRHYQIIADASPVPVIMYNVPGRTGSNVEAKTSIELSKHPNIIGVKEASGDLYQCLDIMRDKDDDFSIISGDDILTTPMIAIGTQGVISVMTNAYPKQFSEMIHAALNDDFKAANKLLMEFILLDDLLYQESNPVGIKEVLYIQGVCKNFVRDPLVSASEELNQKIAAVCKKMKL